MANKKENIKNLVKRMFLSISIMSFFVSAGIENVNAMNESIFEAIKKGRADNKSRRNAVPVPASMTTLEAKQDNSGYRLAVPDSPTPDPKTGVEGGSFIIKDLNKDSGFSEDTGIANSKNPIPFIFKHYGIEHSKNFIPKAMPLLPKEAPEYIKEYLIKHDFVTNYAEIAALANNIYSNDAMNDIDTYNGVKRYSEGCLLSLLKNKALRKEDGKYANSIEKLQSVFSDFLFDSPWSYVEQDTLKGSDQFAEMCFKASEMISGECGKLLWNISLLGNNINAIAYLYDDFIPSDAVIAEKRVQAANVLMKFISEVKDDEIKQVLLNFHKLCINEIRTSMNAILGDLL